MSFRSTSFLIDGTILEMGGFCREILDTAGAQTVVAPFGLMLWGLCYRVDEQWAPSFAVPITGWTLAFAVPTTSWTGVTLPTSTTWTLQSF